MPAAVSSAADCATVPDTMQLRIAGRTIGYDDVGAGPALVLLHPFPLDRRAWAGAVEELRRANRVLTVDARGFGESDLGGRYSIADLADDVAALLDARGVATATVAGQSMGGYTALAFAARHPARLRAMVLANTRAAADTPAAREGRAAAIAAIRDEGVGVYLDRSLPRLLASTAPPALLASVRALAELRPDHLVAGIEALRDRPDRSAELSKIRVPVLVISGARDQIVPSGEMLEMSRALPASRLVSLERAGHLANLEMPDRFVRALRDFLPVLGPS